LTDGRPARVEVPVRRFPSGEGLPLPAYATEGSAGLDLPAAVSEPLLLEPGARALVPTGFGIALPEGYEAQVRPRSGLALRHGLTLLNSPGTVDSDYRGEIQVIVVNLGQAPVVVNRGDRIAQMIVAPVTHARIALQDGLPATVRGAGGFGHTGS